MTDRQNFVLINDRVKANAMLALTKADDFSRVTIAPPKRSADQNAMLHAILTDLSRSELTWAGKPRTVDEWKALVVSGHAVATGAGGEVVPGLEGEFVSIRESTASMGVARATSLIEYVLAFCHTNGVQMTETHKGGFLDERDAA